MGLFGSYFIRLNFLFLVSSPDYVMLSHSYGLLTALNKRNVKTFCFFFFLIRTLNYNFNENHDCHVTRRIFHLEPFEI